MPKVTDNLRNARILADFSNLEPAQVDYFRNNYPDFVPPKWWDEQISLDAAPAHDLRHHAEVKLIDKATARSLIKAKGQSLTEDQRNKLGEEFGEELKKIHSVIDSIKVPQWRVTQTLLRKWWGHRYKDDIRSLIILLDSIFDPDPGTNFSRIAEWAVREMFPSGVPENVTVQLAGRSLTNRSNLREGYIPMQGAIVYLFQNSWRARICPVCNKRFVAAEPKTKFCSSACSEEDRRRQKREWFRLHGKAWRRKRKSRGPKLPVFRSA